MPCLKTERWHYTATTTLHPDDNLQHKLQKLLLREKKGQTAESETKREREKEKDRGVICAGDVGKCGTKKARIP